MRVVLGTGVIICCDDLCFCSVIYVQFYYGELGLSHSYMVIIAMFGAGGWHSNLGVVELGPIKSGGDGWESVDENPNTCERGWKSTQTTSWGGSTYEQGKQIFSVVLASARGTKCRSAVYRVIRPLSHP